METLGLVLIPLIMAVLLPFVPRRDKAAIRIFSCGSLIFTSFIVIILAFRFIPGSGLQSEVIVPWLPKWGLNLSLAIDGISLPFLILTAILGPLGLLYSTDIKEQSKEFHILYLILVSGAYGLFLSQNLFFIFFFLEFEILTAFFLLLFNKQKNSEKNAFQFIIFSSLAGLLFLTFAGIIFVKTGAQGLELDYLRKVLSKNPIETKAAFSVLLVSLGILSALFPFHAWGPIAYRTASRGTNVMLVGVIKKTGPFLMIRLLLELFPSELKMVALPLMILCCINIIYVGWIAMSQKDPKMMAAYASSSHMGYIVLGILSFSTLGVTGAIILAFAHGLMSALLFANLGRIEEQINSFKFGDIKGLGKQAPFLYFTFAVACLAGAGLPGLANFVGEIMIFFSLVTINKTVLAIAIFGVLLSAVYFLRAIKNIFHGAPSSAPSIQIDQIQDEKPIAKFSTIIILIFLLIAGVLPLPLLGAITPDIHKNLTIINSSLSHK